MYPPLLSHGTCPEEVRYWVRYTEHHLVGETKKVSDNIR
jgi:hypothetical protein